eukprot:757554-Hanusia_phi.AAC.1
MMFSLVDVVPVPLVCFKIFGFKRYQLSEREQEHRGMAHYCDTVGIDLGTTRSCVAVWDGTQVPPEDVDYWDVHVIANESGDNTTPSWVCYPDLKQRRVGKFQAAERAGTKYASSVIYHSKRLIGCRYGEKVIQDAANLRWPFRVVDQGDGGAAIQITVAGQPKIVTPEEVGAGILSYLKKVAEEFIGRPVKKAVITVPAYFNDSQRQATRDAGRPTAAALAFGVLDSHSIGTKNLLVDCSLGKCDGGHKWRVRCSTSEVVRATDGDTRLGGEDIDARLVDHFLDVFHKHTGAACQVFTDSWQLMGTAGVDLANAKESDKKKKALAKLRAAAAQLKIDLSRMTESDVCLDELYQVKSTCDAARQLRRRPAGRDLGGQDDPRRVRVPCEPVAPALLPSRPKLDRQTTSTRSGRGGLHAVRVCGDSLDPQVLLVGGGWHTRPSLPSSPLVRLATVLSLPAAPCSFFSSSLSLFAHSILVELIARPHRINPDEAIAVGAAMDGSHQYQVTSSSSSSCSCSSSAAPSPSACPFILDLTSDCQMVDVVPRALGVATANHEDPSRQVRRTRRRRRRGGGRRRGRRRRKGCKRAALPCSLQFTTIIIPACSPIPEGGLIVTSSFGTSRDNQT